MSNLYAISICVSVAATFISLFLLSGRPAWSPKTVTRSQLLTLPAPEDVISRPDFIPNEKWDESNCWGSGKRCPRQDGTIPNSLVRLSMKYRGCNLGMRSSDQVGGCENLNGKASSSPWVFFVLDDLLMPEEIQQLLTQASKYGFGPPHNKYGQLIDDKSVRSDTAVSFWWNEVAEILWPRIYYFFPGIMFRVFGMSGSLNPHLRISKYAPGGKFRCHYDSPYIDPKDPYNVSWFTLLVYLTNVTQGGETRFINEKQNLVMDVPPQAGRAVVFDYKLLHCGQEVIKGEKIVLKMDVMVENTRAKMPPGALD